MRAHTIRAWRLVHTWTSLVCTGFLLVLCVTGLPLIFHDDVDGWLAHAPPYPAVPATAVAASLDRMAAAAAHIHPGLHVRDVILDDDEPQAVFVLASAVDGPIRMPQRVSFDSRTGALRQNGLPAGAGVMAFVLRLHAFLLAGLPGGLLLTVMGLLFVAALVSGTVLYAPFMRRLTYGEVRRGGSGRLAALDLHNLVGVTALVWTLVVGATGVLNTLSTPLFGLWEVTDVARVLRPYAGRPATIPTAGLQAATDAARAAVPGGEVASITYPAHFLSSPAHYVVWMRGGRTLTSRLQTPVLVDARSGRVARVVAMPWYLRALEISRPLHFGDYGGPVLKVLWAILDLLTIGVLVTGLQLWWTKRRRGASGGDIIGAQTLASETLASGGIA